MSSLTMKVWHGQIVAALAEIRRANNRIHPETVTGQSPEAVAETKSMLSTASQTLQHVLGHMLRVSLALEQSEDE